MKSLATLLILAISGCGLLAFFLWQERQDHAAALERLTMSHEVALARQEDRLQEALAEQSTRHQERLKAVTEDFDARLDALRHEQRRQITAAYQEFESIFEGNRQTIDYINLLEGKVRGGQQLSRQEVEKLTVITTGLSHLQKQYQKPMQEFAELEAYFERQAARRPATEPKRGGFFKRLFSRDAREAERQSLRDEGQRQAFEQAQDEFGRVYASAQQQMEKVSLDTDQQLRKLDALIAEKAEANQQDLISFFEKARQALRTHQEVLQFEALPDPLPGIPAP
jgi:hypothetical protein